MKMRLTMGQAVAQGFVVDCCVYPHFGYKGSRFNPTEAVKVFTALESAFIGTLESYGVDMKKLVERL